jgi:uncharacterized protein (TIGR03435 family)
MVWRFRTVALLVLPLLGSAKVTCAQERPSFEVAAIKPSDPNSSDQGVSWHENNSRVLIRNHTVKRLVTLAYEVEMFRVLGGPDWIDSQKYDIDAKIPDELASAHRDPHAAGWMLQSLLADRFKLAVHKEVRKLAIYELVVSKDGSKLKVSTSGNPKSNGRSKGDSIHFVFEDVPLSRLIDRLSLAVGRHVVDGTNLTDRYDFTLDYAAVNLSAKPPEPGTAQAAADSGPTIFEALQQQLGLKLESKEGPVDVYLIDHVQKADPN